MKLFSLDLLGINFKIYKKYCIIEILEGNKIMDDETTTKIMKMAVLLYEEGHTSDKIVNSIGALYPKMDLKSLNNAIINSTEMLLSFNIAVNKAGGSGWPVNKLLKMTFMDLLSALATNHIRFIFDKPKEEMKS